MPLNSPTVFIAGNVSLRTQLQYCTFACVILFCGSTATSAYFPKLQIYNILCYNIYFTCKKIFLSTSSSSSSWSCSYMELGHLLTRSDLTHPQVSTSHIHKSQQWSPLVPSAFWSVVFSSSWVVVQASDPKVSMGSIGFYRVLLFRDTEVLTWRVCVSIFNGQISWPLKMWPIGCPETSVRNYYYSLRNNPEQRSSPLLQILLPTPALNVSTLPTRPTRYYGSTLTEGFCKQKAAQNGYITA